MTDRYYALTVILEKDIREDDAEPILNAIRMIKGVQDVKGNVSDVSTYIAQEKARRHFGEKLWHVLYPEDKDD